MNGDFIAGPWVAETEVTKDDSGDGLAVIAVIPEHGFGTPTRGIVAWVHCGLFGACNTDEKAIATARLIAAAPDLLAALKEISRWRYLVGHEFKPIEIGAAFERAAMVIAKAEGRS
jgi:hypothetical protein